MNALTFDSRLWGEAERHGTQRGEIALLVVETAKVAAKLLPSKFTYLNVVTTPTTSDWVIPETGVMGMAYSDEYLSITFDAAVPYGVDNLKRALRSTVYHEMVHATTFAHDPWRPSALFGAVTEGLATVFERDYSGEGAPLWAEYESDDTMKGWYEEIRSLPQTEQKDMNYFVSHSDGRKWIVYKTGTWMIDRLLESGEDLFALMKLPHIEIVGKLEAL